jgi:hypothetical protein
VLNISVVLVIGSGDSLMWLKQHLWGSTIINSNLSNRNDFFLLKISIKERQSEVGANGVPKATRILLEAARSDNQIAIIGELQPPIRVRVRRRMKRWPCRTAWSARQVSATCKIRPVVNHGVRYALFAFREFRNQRLPSLSLSRKTTYR